jgi:glucose-1-phosphatase
MPLPKLVIFDMDDVLCRYEVGRRLRYLASLAGTTARDVRAAIWDSTFEDEADAGGVPDADIYLAEFSKRLGFALTKDQWLEARRLSMVANDDVISLARSIGAQADLAIFTNNGPLVKDHFEVLLPEIKGVFARRHCSFEFGTKKPDPEAFLRLARHIGIAPDACWFIDDKKSNVEGARIAGMRGHLFRTEPLLRDDATALGFAV